MRCTSLETKERAFNHLRDEPGWNEQEKDKETLLRRSVQLQFTIKPLLQRIIAQQRPLENITKYCLSAPTIFSYIHNQPCFSYIRNLNLYKYISYVLQ
jgi:hypothetical protein